MKVSLFKSLLIGYCCIAFSSIANEPKEIVVGWELWYPYQFHDEQDELTGMDIEIFDLIAKKARWNYSYVELPWKRHLSYIKNGLVGVAFGASPSKEREQYAYFSKAYRYETVNLFVRKGESSSISLKQLSDLIDTKYLIGIEHGYYYGKAFQELNKRDEFKARIRSVVDLEQNAKSLIDKEIDGLLADPATMKFFIEKYKLHGEFEQHTLKIYQSSIHIMLSKKLATMDDITNIDNAISALEKSGQLPALKQKWTEFRDN